MQRILLGLTFLGSALACSGAGTSPPATPSVAPTAPPVAPVAPSTAPQEAPAGAPPAAALATKHPDWHTEAVALGDLTGDGTPDQARILSQEKNGETTVTLEVSFRDPSANPLLIEAPKAVCAQCGGVKGLPIPFEIAILEKTHVLSLTYTGGSREMSSRTTKWRLKNGRMEMIGVVETIADTLAGEKGMIASITREANLSTLQMTETVETVAGVVNDTIQTSKKTVNCAVTSPQGVPSLADYSEDSYSTPRCSDQSVE